MRAAVFAVSLTLFATFAACAADAEHDLSIESGSGATHRFTIELALTDAEQQRGLMYRDTLADDAGMLFFYEACLPASFWMKNTLVPLDMIFIEADGRIVRIAAMTVPETLDIHNSGVPVNGVLEIRGGLAGELGIEAGDVVHHPWFGEGGRATCG